MAAHRTDAPHPHAGGHPTVPIYLAVFGTLMVLTAVTVGIAFVDLGWMNPVMALVIATFKAVIVILYFMHVKYSGKLVMLTVVGGFFWLLILLGLTMTDYLSRSIMGVFAR